MADPFTSPSQDTSKSKAKGVPAPLGHPGSGIGVRSVAWKAWKVKTEAWTPGGAKQKRTSGPLEASQDQELLLGKGQCPGGGSPPLFILPAQPAPAGTAGPQS